jgi:hypothetical protein
VTRRRSSAAASAAGENLLFVDAIEGDFARLLAGEDAFNVPTRLLPAGAKEGSWLRATFQLAPPPPDDGAAALREKLGRDDDGGDIKL